MIRQRNLGSLGNGPRVKPGGKDWVPENYAQDAFSVQADTAGLQNLLDKQRQNIESQVSNNNKALLLGAAALAYFLLMKG